MLCIAHWPVRVQGIGKDMPSKMFSFINFELLELYWTYFLALQIMNSKILPMRLELGSWVENEMLCHELEPWDWWDNIAMGFGPWASASFCVNMGSFGL